jgi:acetoin utilization deacetylase AcuC-like enzyme
MGQHHPECPERLQAIEDQLILSRIDYFFTRISPPLATEDQLALIHTQEHIQRIKALSPKEGYSSIDGDTNMNPHTWNAALRSAGGAIAAVDAVMQGEVKNAFTCLRPPGHHAEPDQAMGFCFFNNIAIAAKHAMEQYGLERVAIVDFDVHHGNGTEEVIRNLTPRKTFLPLPSSWAPISATSYKPWLNESDADDVFFSSINLFSGERFYPCSGDDSPSDENKNIVNISMTPIGPGPWDPKAKHALSSAKKKELCAIASAEMREKVSKLLLPKLQSFKADVLLISAGFDAHFDDFYHFLTDF